MRRKITTLIEKNLLRALFCLPTSLIDYPWEVPYSKTQKSSPESASWNHKDQDKSSRSLGMIKRSVLQSANWLMASSGSEETR